MWRTRKRYSAITAAAVTVALVAVTLTQTSGRGASAAASPVRMPTVEETIAGILSVADHYPGGLP